MWFTFSTTPLLRTNPPVIPPTATALAGPTLWIAPSTADHAPLSADVECLKWQAYLALRNIQVLTRTDIHPEGALDTRLPNLHVDDKTLLPAHLIPQWADQHAPPEPDYISQHARDESRAWVALLENTVHAALLAAAPVPSYFKSLLSLNQPSTNPLIPLLSPPPPPATGITSILPPYGEHISYDTIFARYRDAITALSDRLGTDKWFLGSTDPTPLDALAFAYLHCIVMSSNNTLCTELKRRVNLVAWEWRVREQIRAQINRT